MNLGDGQGAPARLQVNQPGLKVMPNAGEVGHLAARDVHSNNAANEGIQLFDIPIAVHVGLAKTQRPPGQDTCVEPGIMDLDIPGIRSVQTDTTLFEKIGDQFLSKSRHNGFRCAPISVF